MKRARDVMTANPVKLNYETSIDEAIQLFLENRFHSLPVVNEGKEACGVISEISIIKIIALKAKNTNLLKIKDVSDHIEEAILVDPQDQIKDFLSEVIAKSNNRVLVVDEETTLLGIISPRDILRLLAGAQ
jgi:predicted transcriptional regulator